MIISVFFIIMPGKYIKACQTGISLWAACVLPATFPFLFLTALITRLGYVNKISSFLAPATKKIFNLPGISGYVLLMSVISGYPIGAKIIADLKEGGVISSLEATKISVVASTSGPLFILGSVGTNMFSSVKIGSIILLSHYLATILGGIILRGKKRKSAEKNFKLKTDENEVLYSAMYSSVISVLCVGGFIAAFYTLSVMLEDMKILYPLSFIIDSLPFFGGLGGGIAKGLIEMTSGCGELAASGNFLAVPACAFIITLGGLSIIFQQLAYLKKAGVKTGFFLLSKILQATLAFIICLLLSLIDLYISMPLSA